jgi:hypothetical protein
MNSNENSIGSPAHLQRLDFLYRRVSKKIPEPVLKKILDFAIKTQQQNPHLKFDADLPVDEAFLLLLYYCVEYPSEKRLCN